MRTNEAVMNKLNQVRSGSQRLGQLTADDFDEAKKNVADFVALAQTKYGYTKDQAEQEVGRYLDNYDRSLNQFARCLPGDVDRKVMRRPWLALTTAIGLGFLAGFLMKPGR